MFDETPGGRYRVNGVIVDAEGKELKGDAAKPPAGDSAGRDPSDVHSGPFQDNFPYREVLEAAGFADQEAVANANDEELLAVDGIGPARLKEIRAYQGG